MFKFQLATKKDIREAAIIAKKRAAEAERMKRIFNARNRIFGIDVDALDAQVIEKRKIDNERREEDLRFEAEDKRRANVMRINAEQLAQERYRVESEINVYRRQHQKRQDTREFDLNDPQRLLHGRAARDGDNDPRLGVSSAQLFLGEDLTNPERHRVQRDQQRAWLQQQMAERRTTDADRRHADHQHQLAMEAHDRVAVRSDQAERQTRQQICAAAAEFNRRLAAEQAARRVEREREEQEDNMAEIYNNLTSDMLTENPNAADSNLGLGRKNMSSYRGKTEEELQELYREQSRQQVERTKRDNEAKALDAQWNQMTNGMARMHILKEREMERKKCALDQQLLEENARLADEQKTRLKHLDQVVYTNRPTIDYFSKFNTSTR